MENSIKILLAMDVATRTRAEMFNDSNGKLAASPGGCHACFRPTHIPPGGLSLESRAASNQHPKPTTF